MRNILHNTHQFTLDNGFRVVITVRRHSPIVHFNLMFKIGHADAPAGKAGLPHLVEHLAFRGTTNIGSADPEKELRILSELDDLWAQIRAGAGKPPNPSVQSRFELLRAEANLLGDKERLKQIVSYEGGIRHDGATGYDWTSFRLTLPRNAVAFWAELYSDILMNSVFRGFFEELEYIAEERRQLHLDEPGGYLFEKFMEAAYSNHPYSQSPIGDPDRLLHTCGRNDALEFWNSYFRPNNAVLGIVGDVDPDSTIQVIADYFAAMPSGLPMHQHRPPIANQKNGKRINITMKCSPLIYVGYYQPSLPDRDAYVLQLISAILSSSRSSGLRKTLLDGEGNALSVQVSSGLSSILYNPNLFLISARLDSFLRQPLFESVLYSSLEKLATVRCTQSEIDRAINHLHIDFFREIESHEGLAHQLCIWEIARGGWQMLFEYPCIVSSITSSEIMDVAGRYFDTENRIVATIGDSSR